MLYIDLGQVWSDFMRALSYIGSNRESASKIVLESTKRLISLLYEVAYVNESSFSFLLEILKSSLCLQITELGIFLDFFQLAITC